MDNEKKRVEGKKPLILIVDDHGENIQLLAKLLEDVECKISAANNGIQAIQITEKVKPDLILLDIMMPELDGYETCKILKYQEDTKNIPIIFLTGKTSIEDIIKGFEVGAVDYVVKPFNSVELISRVRTHLQLKTTLESQAQLIDELQKALKKVKLLSGLLPICSNCKKIRDDNGYWKQVEEYIAEYSEAEFSHSLCSGCIKELYPGMAKKILGEE